MFCGMREHIAREISAMVFKLENQLAQLDRLQNRKRAELEQYRQALHVIRSRAARPIKPMPAKVIPIRVAQLKSAGQL